MDRRGLDLALDAWTRSSGSPVDPARAGAGPLFAAATILEVARGRTEAARVLAQRTERDPRACAIAGAALGTRVCAEPEPPRSVATAMDAGFATGRAQLESKRVGKGAVGERVLRSVVRACAMRNADAMTGVSVVFASSSDAADGIPRCVRDAIARERPGAEYRVVLTVLGRAPP